MRLTLSLLIGRLVRLLARLRGGGSAIPGRIAMLLEPKLLEKTLGALPHGLIFVSGSNGKSTTTALVSGVLRSQGLRVFSNPSGGNMPQGIASAVIGKANLSGKLDADVAVLEVDEAYGQLLAQHVRPSWVVLTNIQIDQLNRFFEPDRVYQMLLLAARSATRGVVINGSDANLVELGLELSGQAVSQVMLSESALANWPVGALAAPRFGKGAKSNNLPTAVQVLEEKAGVASFQVGDLTASVTLPGSGLHFAIDAGLALAVGVGILGERFELAPAATQISNQETVYGRGEVVRYREVEIQILMMKNPSSMRATLISMPKPETSVWIAMDDGTPDPSWLYDIDLSAIGKVQLVSGSRCWHLATRLAYSNSSPVAVVAESKQALEQYVSYLSQVGKRGTLITNYEQMMAIRKHMGLRDLESGK
jgi:lipid II isoglutaminyl synthase (glutamine-hydrolysing)